MRYTRHELKQDKFAESAVEAVHEVVEHRAGIIRIAVVVLVLAMVGGGIYWYMSSREDAGGERAGRGADDLQRPGGGSGHAAAGLDGDLQQRPGAVDRGQEGLLRRQRQVWLDRFGPIRPLHGRDDGRGTGQRRRWPKISCARSATAATATWPRWPSSDWPPSIATRSAIRTPSTCCRP